MTLLSKLSAFIKDFVVNYIFIFMVVARSGMSLINKGSVVNKYCVIFIYNSCSKH